MKECGKIEKRIKIMGKLTVLTIYSFKYFSMPLLCAKYCVAHKVMLSKTSLQKSNYIRSWECIPEKYISQENKAKEQESRQEHSKKKNYN